jgi:NAD(P)H-dependent FMN reductase
MVKIAIIIGSTRPGRNGGSIARWVYDTVNKRHDVYFEVVDIAKYNLPLLDEPMGAASGKYTKEHTQVWSAKISEFDGFVFVTPEYNHGTSGALKNAIDYLYREWNNKAAGFVGYGASGGLRAVESLRLVMAEMMVADVRAQVALSLYADFENYNVFKPAPHQEASVNTMIAQVIDWSKALKTLREAT